MGRQWRSRGGAPPRPPTREGRATCPGVSRLGARETPPEKLKFCPPNLNDDDLMMIRNNRTSCFADWKNVHPLTETGVSRYNGKPIKGPPETPQYNGTVCRRQY